MKLSKPLALLSAELVFPLPRGEDVAAAAKKLPGAAKPRTGTPARGALLSSSDEDPYFVRYVLDDEDVPAAEIALFRVTLRLRPVSSPPSEMVEKRDNGETAQSFFTAAQEMIARHGFGTALFEARLRVEAGGLVLPSVIASPVAADGSVLELTGATYRAATTPKAGLFFLSWYREPPDDSLFLRVGSVEPALNLATANPWEILTERCGQLLAATS